MRTRKRFSAEFKAKGWHSRRSRAMRRAAELATNLALHPTQIATRKRQAIEKLAQVFDENGRRRAQNRDAELTKLHAGNGQRMVNAIVW